MSPRRAPANLAAEYIDADLFLWLYQRRRALKVVNPTADFDSAARDARGQHVRRRFRREFLREKSSPLPLT